MEKNEMTEKSEMNETIENKAKENVVIDDFDFYLIGDFKRKIRIADIGCGKGNQTFVLAAYQIFML